MTLNNQDKIHSPLDQLEEVESLAPPPPDPEKMFKLLTSADKKEQMLAARTFCDVEDARAIPYLMELIKDLCPLVRVSAAYALGRNPSADAVNILIETLSNDWNGYVRKGVVWALGNCGDRRSLQPLLHALKTDISAVRLWAASSLANIARLHYDDIIVTMPILIEGLRRDVVPGVRSNCAWAIGQLARELPSNVVYATAIDSLIEALVEDEDFGVKEDAKFALLKVGDTHALQMIEELELEGLI